MKIKKFIVNILYPFFYLTKKIIFRKPQLRILMFHYITSAQYQKFENLIIKLKKEYNIISPSEFDNIIKKNKTISQDTILFTFDDGYKSQYNIAKKILNKHNIKGIFFITLNFVKLKSKLKTIEFLKNNLRVGEIKNKEFPNIRNMSNHDLDFLIKSGHEIGAHTIDHKDLTTLSLKDKKYEIIDYKKLFYKKSKIKNINHFAFTFGELKNIDKNSLKISLQNYDFIYSGIRGNNYQSNKRVFFRDNCDLHLSFKEIFFFLNGFGDFYYFFKRFGLFKILKMFNK